MASFVHNLGDAIESLPGDNSVSYLCMGEPWPELENSTHGFGARTFGEEYLVDTTRVRSWCETNSVDLLLCPGNQASRTNGLTVWWPLTVAPYEQIAVSAQSAGGAKARARWAAIRSSLSVSARFADRVVFSSNYARALYQSALEKQLLHKPSTVIRPSTSIEIRPNRPSSPPYLLGVSNFNRYKFLLEILEAFAESENFKAGWRLKLAGRFPDLGYEREANDLIEALGIRGSIDLMGEQTPAGLVPLYQAATGFVFASVSENAASYTVIDALAYGLPTISSFYSSTPEIVGMGALYADPFSPADLSSKMSMLLLGGEAERLSRAALQQARGFPSWEEIASQLMEFGLRSLDR